MNAISYINYGLLVLALVLNGSKAFGSLPRVASLSPQASDLLIELGKKDSLFASVERYSGPPHPTLSLGSFLHPNAERIFGLKPDWIVTDDLVPLSPAKKRWEGAGTQTLVLRLRTVEELGGAAGKILSEIFHDENSAGIAARLALCLTGVKSQAPVPKKAVLFVSLRPAVLAAEGSFLHSLLEHAGYQNLADPSWKAPYPQVTEEWIIAHPPEAVFFLEHGYGEALQAKELAKKWWPNQSPQLAALSQEPFARASFATLKHWESFGRITPRECYEIN